MGELIYLQAPQDLRLTRHVDGLDHCMRGQMQLLSARYRLGVFPDRLPLALGFLGLSSRPVVQKALVTLSSYVCACNQPSSRLPRRDTLRMFLFFVTLPSSHLLLHFSITRVNCKVLSSSDAQSLTHRNGCETTRFDTSLAGDSRRL